MNARATALRSGLLLSAALFSCLPAHAGEARGLEEATPDVAEVTTGESVLIDVLANDVDIGATRRLVSVLPAGSGSTRVENGHVRYTPEAGFVGSDQFQYLVQAPKSPPRIGTVTVEVGGGGVLLTISGQVVDEPIPGATVTISVGGIDFTAVADANGYYVIDVAALSGDDFVTIHATGTSASGAPVDFVSLVGAIARLDGEAGDDGVLTMDENNQVNVTHLSTAQYVLLAEANGGTPPEDDEGLLQLTQNIDIDELIELAAVIKLVVDGGEPLPDGVTSVIDLISDETALDGFIAALDEGQLQAAIDDVSGDTADLAGFAADRLPDGYAAIFPGDTGTIRVGINGQFLLHFDGVDGVAGSGSGEIVTSDFRDDPGITWEIVGPTLRVRYTTPDIRTFFNQGGPSCPYHVVATTTGMDVTRLQDGAAVDYLQVGFVGGNDFVDEDAGDGCDPPADVVFDGSDTWTMLGFEEGEGELPFGATESLGTMMLVHFRPERYVPGASNNPWAVALFDFATSQVSIPGVDPTFAWSIAGGHLHVTLADPVNGARAYEYRRYQTDGHKGEGLMAIVTNVDGRRAAAYSLAARVDGSLPAFTEAMLPGRWRSGFDISQFPTEADVATGFFLRFHGDAAHTGTFESLAYDEFGVLQQFLGPPFTWGIATGVDAGAMEALTYRLNGFNVTWCDVAVTGCRLFRRRTWTPVAMDGDRIYVMERLIYTIGGYPTIELISERANFYEVGPIP